MTPQSQRKFMQRTANIYRHQTRRARQPLDYTLEQLREWCRPAMGSPCDYCGCILTPANFSLDHHTPLARGGPVGADNLDLCCLRCNQIKGMMTGAEFQALLDLIHTWPPAVGANVLDAALHKLHKAGAVHCWQDDPLGPQTALSA